MRWRTAAAMSIGGRRGSFGRRRGAFGRRRRVFGPRRPVFGPRRPVFGPRRPVFGPRRPVFRPEATVLWPQAAGPSAGGGRSFGRRRRVLRPEATVLRPEAAVLPTERDCPFAEESSLWTGRPLSADEEWLAVFQGAERWQGELRPSEQGRSSFHERAPCFIERGPSSGGWVASSEEQEHFFHQGARPLDEPVQSSGPERPVLSTDGLLPSTSGAAPLVKSHSRSSNHCAPPTKGRSPPHGEPRFPAEGTALPERIKIDMGSS
jgi:hypothetical protein